MEGWLVRKAAVGVLLVWIGIMMAIDERPGIASLGAGVILLLTALARRAYGARAGFILTASGLLLIALGFADLNGDDNGIPLFGVVMISFGTLIILRAVNGVRWVRRTVKDVQVLDRRPRR